LWGKNEGRGRPAAFIYDVKKIKKSKKASHVKIVIIKQK